MLRPPAGHRPGARLLERLGLEEHGVRAGKLGPGPAPQARLVV